MNEAVTFVVPVDHPCLAGHFPGEPVVPGVLLLAAALQAMGVAANQPRTLAWVKFLRPLLPAQQAEIHYRETDGELRFEVLSATGVLVRGALTRGAAQPNEPTP